METRALALILAGGRGKRMDVLCYLRPKPALPFAGGYRVIDFTLSNCIHSGISDIAALIDYQRVDMAQYLKKWHTTNSQASSLSILPPSSGSYAGTADAVYQNLDVIESQDPDVVFILAGDHVYKMDYRKMLEFHEKMHADATVGIVRVSIEEAYRFGTVKLDTDRRIIDFVEKSSSPETNLASMGIYIFNREMLIQYVSKDADKSSSTHDFGYAILPEIVKKENVFAYEFGGYWQDIGTVESYFEANMELLGIQPRFSLDSNWPILTETEISEMHMSSNNTGTIVNSLVSEGCVIRGRVNNSILSPGVRIGERTEVRDSILMPDVAIGDDCVIDRCILDQEVSIGNLCYIGVGNRLFPGSWDVTVFGKEVKVPPGITIGRKCRVLPKVDAADFIEKIVSSGSTIYHKQAPINNSPIGGKI
jgi:glucose-1-phosphate adenylyltransferase